MGASDSSLFGNSAELLGEGGGCCDHRDHPTRVAEKNSPQGKTAQPAAPVYGGKLGPHKLHNDEELEILVRERIRQNSKKDAPSRLAYSDPSIDSICSSVVIPSPDSSSTFETVSPSIPLFGSFQMHKNWKVTVAISSAVNLPKTDLLGSLSDIACCASVFKTDAVNNIMSLGQVAHEINGTNGPFQKKDSGFRVKPQFRSTRKENLLPRDLINPCWDETFTATECHRDLEFAASMWRSRRSNDDGSGPCVLFVSIHDTQAQKGEDEVIGEVWIPLRPGAGVVDSWYPLLTADGEPVKGHGGSDSSVNLRTSFTA